MPLSASLGRAVATANYDDYLETHWIVDDAQPYEIEVARLAITDPGYGQADTVLAARQTTLTAAHAAHPERFVRQPPRPLALPREVWINPPADGPELRMLQLPHDTNFVPQLFQTY
jgi:hypothetical protein